MSGRILIVEDEAIIGRFIQRSLEEAGYQVTAVVRTAAEAIAQTGANAPDLAVVDIGLEGSPDGVALAGELRTRWGVPFVYVTAHNDEATIERLKITEPLGYVSKPFNASQLLGTVKLALHQIDRHRERAAARAASEAEAADIRARADELERGLRRIADLVRETGVAQPGRPAPHREVPLPEVPGLSKREVQVLGLLLANRRVPAIARQLGVSPHTVRNHLKAVFRKAGVHSQTELIERFDPARPK